MRGRVIWAVIALAAIIAAPTLLEDMRAVTLWDVLPVAAFVAVVVLVGNFLGIAQRVDEISKRK